MAIVFINPFWDYLVYNLPTWIVVFLLMLAASRDFVKQPRRRVIALALGVVVLCGVCEAWLSYTFENFEVNLTLGLLLVVFFLVLTWSTTLPLHKRLFVFWTGVAAVAFSVLLTDMVAVIAWRVNHDLVYNFDVVVSVVAPLALLPLFAGRIRRALAQMDDELWRGLWLVPVAFLASATALYALRGAVKLETLWAALAYALACLFLIVLLVVAYRALFDTLQKSMENERLRAEVQVAAFQAARYTALRDRMRESAQARHDFRHRLVVLDALAQKGDMEGLRAALAEYGELAAGVPERGTLCANFAVDAVAAHFLGRARTAGIEVRCELAALPEQLPMAESDVCMVLANLLENAVEASERLDEDAARRISVSATMQGAALILSVQNTCAPGEDLPLVEVCAAAGLPSAKRPGMGVGLTSAAALATKHRGEVRIERNHTTFTAIAVLRG